MIRIRNRILRLDDGCEKEFLWDVASRVSQAIKKNDIQRLDILNERLVGIFDGLSEEAQKIAQEISKKIMEVRNE
jgi:hypothetical protein